MNRVDPSTLGWVKTEIDNTLKQARLALESYAENSADTTRLRFFITHLHQVVGTLQMVELDGAALLAREIEAIAEAMLNGETGTGEEVFEAVTRAILSLSEYLDQLLLGRPDVAVRLVPVLNRLRAARGEAPMSESALFNPDLSVFPAVSDTAESLSDDHYAELALELRRTYLGALLNWLRDSGDTAALGQISDVLDRLSEVSRFSAVAQLWWVARGLLEALHDGVLDPSDDVKKLLVRIDWQIRKLIQGTEAALIRDPADEIISSMLFHIGKSRAPGALGSELRAAFDLDLLLADEEGGAGPDLAEAPSQETLRSVTRVLGQELETAQEQLSAYFDPQRGDVTDLQGLVGHLTRISKALDTLGVRRLKDLVDQLVHTCEAVSGGIVDDPEKAALQMASAMITVQNASRDMNRPEVDWTRQIQSSLAALRALEPEIEHEEAAETLGGFEVAETALTESEYEQLLGVVAGEIHVNLQKVEEAVEAFAADTNNAAALQEVPEHLAQIQGALQILGQENAAELVQTTTNAVRDIQRNRLQVDGAMLDALAIAIGSVEAFVEGLEHNRPAVHSLIDDATQGLRRASAGRQLADVEPAQLLASLEAGFDAWAARRDDPDRLQSLRQQLTDMGIVAERLDQDTIGKISAELVNLLDVVSVDASFLTEDIMQTLSRSFDALVALARSAFATAGVPAPDDRAVGVEPVEAATSATVEPEPVAAEPVADVFESEQDDEILEIFLEEAQEVHEAIGHSLASLTKAPEDQAALAELRRAFHTLKGSGRLAGATDIGEQAWIVENLLNQVINGKIPLRPEMFPFLADARELVGEMVANFRNPDTAPFDLDAWRARAEQLAADAAQPASRAAPAPPRAEPEPAPVPDEVIEISGDLAAAETAGGALPPELDDAVVREIFVTEARTHLATIERELDGCARDPEACRISQDLLRAVHTLQGSSRSLGLNNMAEACSRLEEMLEAMSLLDQPIDREAGELAQTLHGLAATLINRVVAGNGMDDALAASFDDLGDRLAARLEQLPETPPWYMHETLKPAPHGATPSAGEPARQDTAPPPVTEVIEEPGDALVAEQPAPPEAVAAEPAIDEDVLLDDLQEEASAVEDMVDEGLREIFFEEALDILGQMNDALARWRTDGAGPAVVAELKRALHTLKGSARMARAEEVGDLSHNTESLLGRVEVGTTDSGPAVVGLLEEVHDTLADAIDRMQRGEPVSDRADLNARVMQLVEGEMPAPAPEAARVTPQEVPPEPPREFEPEPQAATGAFEPEPAAPQEAEASAGEEPAEPPLATEPQAAATVQDLPDVAAEPVVAEWPEAAAGAEEEQGEEAVEGTGEAERRDERRGLLRVSSRLLDDLANYAGEVSIARSRMQEQVFGFRENLRELTGNVVRFRDQLRELEIQAESQIMSRLDETGSNIVDDFDPLEFDRFTRMQQLSRGLSESLNDLVTIQSGLHNFVGDIESALSQQGRLNTELQEGLMRSRMVSFATQAPRLRHIVRQTARELGKHVEFDIRGAHVQIDRKVLERMMGPLEHMIRNAVDHGIEPRADRLSAGKSADGHITMTLEQEANEVVIRFSDDGRGLNLSRIAERARAMGLVHPDTDLSDGEMAQLIMQPGFSTAEQITQVSGRGVGMDVVHNEVKQLGGSIAIESRSGAGTTFTVRLPLTLSIMQALVVRSGEQSFAIPVASIIRILKVPAEQIREDADGHSVFVQGEETYPYMHLAQRLGLPGGAREGKAAILLVRAGTHAAALEVDDIHQRQEIVVKTLGPQLAELSGMGGATILGDGSVVLILDVSELWVTKEVTTIIEPEARARESQRVPVVMVVDDSLTVRKVTERLLRKHDMEVVLAKDGMEALERLREGRPDVMLVDIEMPRMDGFELTSRVRGDSETRDIPIIIITSRAGAKHRLKAMELGANVYLTKPYQEDELLANIERLMGGARVLH